MTAMEKRPIPGARTKRDFLRRAYEAAVAAGHLFPKHAACEAALESSWGRSVLAVKYHNLLGQKQGRKFPLAYRTVNLWTQEEYGPGQVATERATWLIFPDWPTCLRERMMLLRHLPSIYGAALAATSGEEFVREVSGCWEGIEAKRHYVGRWATDSQRADKVLAIYAKHADFLKGLLAAPAVPSTPELWGEA